MPDVIALRTHQPYPATGCRALGGAVVLAIVTAVVDAGGAGTLSSAPAALAAYRPALVLITGVAAIGAAVALSGLRRRPAPEAESVGGPAAAELPAGTPALQEAELVDDRPAANG